MDKLIHKDQTGFMKGHLAADNIQRQIHVIYETQQLKTPCAILSLGAEKAFDRLEWQYLWTVLERFGLGKGFVDMIHVLYANPTAMMSTNGLHSNPFPIFRGTRQGCDLSPNLFVLSLEPLAQHLRENQLITPI